VSEATATPALPARASRALSGYALVAIAACSWGTWPVFLRHAEAIAPVPVALESAVVMIVLTLVSAPFCLRDRVPVRATPAQWLAVAWLGIADALNVILFFAAYKHTSVAVAVLTHYLTPILVALGAPFLLGEKVRERTVLAVALSFAGLVLLLRPWGAERRPDDWLGAALGAGSAVFYASNVLVNKRLAGVFSGSELSFYHGLVAAPLLASLVPPAAWGQVHLEAFKFLLAGSITAGGLASLCFVWGLRRVHASHASTLTLLEPLVAVTLAAVLLGEPLAVGSAAGAVLILAGSGIVISSRAAAVVAPA